MTDTLLIDFTTSTQSVNWVRFEGNKHLSSGTDTLSNLVELSSNCQVVVWVPSDELTFTTITVPVGQTRHLDTIIPNLLEEEVAADIDELHFSVSKVSAEGQVNLAIIEKVVLEDWLNLFAEAGLTPNALLPDIYSLPMKENTWSMNIENNVCLLRTSPQLGHVFDVNNLAFMYQMISGDTQPNITAYTSTMIDKVQELPIEFAETLDKLAALPNATVLEMNLLQGDFRPQSSLSRYWKQWKTVAILAAVVLGLHLSNVVGETWQLNQQITQTKSEVKALFHRTFPQEKRLVNVKAQTVQNIQALQAQQNDAGFLMLLQDIAPALQQMSNVSLSRINYERELSEIRLDVKAQQYNELEQLKTKIEQLGFESDLGSVSSEKGAYRARLIIRGQQ